MAVKRTPQERREFCEARASEMAANMTGAERRLWEVLEPLGWQAQSVWSGETKNGGRWDYVTDFYLPAVNLAVEVDGSVHDKRKGRDRRRTERLRVEYGIHLIRFSNNQVLKHRGDVILAIIDKISELSA